MAMNIWCPVRAATVRSFGSQYSRGTSDAWIQHRRHAPPPNRPEPSVGRCRTHRHRGGRRIGSSGCTCRAAAQPSTPDRSGTIRGSPAADGRRGSTPTHSRHRCRSTYTAVAARRGVDNGSSAADSPHTPRRRRSGTAKRSTAASHPCLHTGGAWRPARRRTLPLLGRSPPARACDGGASDSGRRAAVLSGSGCSNSSTPQPSTTQITSRSSRRMVTGCPDHRFGILPALITSPASASIRATARISKYRVWLRPSQRCPGPSYSRTSQSPRWAKELGCGRTKNICGRRSRLRRQRLAVRRRHDHGLTRCGDPVRCRTDAHPRHGERDRRTRPHKGRIQEIHRARPRPDVTRGTASRPCAASQLHDRKPCCCCAVSGSYDTRQSARAISRWWRPRGRAQVRVRRFRRVLVRRFRRGR